MAMQKTNRPTKAANADKPVAAGPDKRLTTPVGYLRAVRSYISNDQAKPAYALVQLAAVQYPDDPLILSYYGWLQALVDKKYRTGVEACTRALVLLKQKTAIGADALYPEFYLNLGRACVAAGKKKDAIVAFKKGLRYDSSNGILQEELWGLGVRKSPPVPFLGRSHPINKYIGKITRKKSK